MAQRFVGLYPGTVSELALEPAVASLGLVYRTNFPFYMYGVDSCFPDFFLPTIGLIIEVDGADHQDPEKREADTARTIRLGHLGYTVARCTNVEARENPELVVKRALSTLTSSWGLPGHRPKELERSLAGRVPAWPIPHRRTHPEKRPAKPGKPRTAARQGGPKASTRLAPAPAPGSHTV